MNFKIAAFIKQFWGSFKEFFKVLYILIDAATR